MSISLRDATPDDVALVLRFIRGLAEYEKLADEVQATEAMRRKWAELGVDKVMALPPAEATRYVAAEVARWEAVMRASR